MFNPRGIRTERSDRHIYLALPQKEAYMHLQDVMIADSVPHLAVCAILKRGPRVPPIR